MNKNSATLIVVGLVALVVGVVVGRFLFGPHTLTDPAAKYVLAFGDPADNSLVTVANLASFQAALASPVGAFVAQPSGLRRELSAQYSE